MVRRTAPLALAAVLACAAPAAAYEPIEPPAPDGAAQAASPAGPLVKPGARAAASSRKLLWATVNVCDTFESPDAMGVRASMPGNGTGQRMYMRFSAQWYSTLRGWLDVPNGRSPWIYVGSARYAARQAGYSFDFQTPPFGRAYILRGIVQYQWRSQRRAKRARYRIARERTALTTTGRRGVRGGDPKGTSKAMCAIANVGSVE